MALTEIELADAYRMHGHLVLMRCRAILRDAAAADDALQEVFVRLMRYGDGLARATSPLRWLYRVADRVCFDMLGKSKRTRELAQRAAAEPAYPSAPGEDVAARDAVMQLLGGEDDRTRQIAVLHYLDGMPQGQVAEELGVSRQTVSKRLRKLRERARDWKVRMGEA